MNASSKLSLAALLLSTSLVACNNSNVVGVPVQPSPTDTPSAPIAIIDSGSPIYSTFDTATFDGSGSYDLDGYVVSYDFSLVAAPPGSTAVLVPNSYGDGTTLYL